MRLRHLSRLNVSCKAVQVPVYFTGTVYVLARPVRVSHSTIGACEIEGDT